MSTQGNYIMREQVRNLIPSIMDSDITKGSKRAETQLHLIAVAVVTTVYLLTAAISG